MSWNFQTIGEYTIRRARIGPLWFKYERIGNHWTFRMRLLGLRPWLFSGVKDES